MALIAVPPVFIEQAVSDYVLGDLRAHQRVRFLKFSYLQDTNGAAAVYVLLNLRRYALVANTDASLPPIEKDIAQMAVELTTDNQTLVDATQTPTMGDILAMRKPEQTDEEWQKTVEDLAATKDVMYQGEFYAWAIENVPFVIAPLIRKNIEQADAMGRFN
jgi:hypothetical protein